jgi:organic radical activating enzyme
MNDRLMIGTPTTGDGDRHDAAGELIVAERFGDEQPTFQGEGPSMGTPALFIRLSRCNLTCGWCDTKFTWDWENYDPRAEAERQSVAELAEWAGRSPAPLVVITGGEPLLQQRPLVPLVRRLLAAGKRVEVETNGTVVPDAALMVDGVRFNVSPKLGNSGVSIGRRVVPEALAALTASGRAVFKFVACEPADLAEIEEIAGRFDLDPIYVLPEGADVQRLLDTTRAVADAVAARGWHLTSRLHVLAFGAARGR